jgi:hypothetical protein
VILRELHQLIGRVRYLFSVVRSMSRNLSDGAANAASARPCYKGVITGYGFSAMARTLLDEFGWNLEPLERLLSHVEAGIAGVYNKAKHLPERRNMNFPPFNLSPALAGVLSSILNGVSTPNTQATDTVTPQSVKQLI